MRYTIEGRAVVVPARVAWLIEAAVGADVFQRMRDQAHRRGDWEAHAVLQALHAEACVAASNAVSRAASAAGGSALAKGAEAVGRSVTSMMTAGAVAAAVGCTARAVRLAAKEGRLSGDFVDGRWWFRADAVAGWQAERAA